MITPLDKIQVWIEEEKELGNVFARGAVLSSISKDGNPTSRVVGTMFDENNIPKFFTSPNSRKIDDIKFNNHVSLTYSFENTLRSISIEGTISVLTSGELDNDWLLHDNDFRKHYVVFGEISGDEIASLDELRKKRDNNESSDCKMRPDSFIGYKFDFIERVSFYSVQENDFAINEVYTFDRIKNLGNYSLLVP